MTTVNCPKCDEQVRMPADASSQASVQCPLCLEEFEMTEALNRLAPLLLVVRDPGAVDTSFAPTQPTFSGTDLVAESEDADSPEFSFAAPSYENSAAANDERAEAATAMDDAAPAFAFEPGSATEGTAGSVSQRRARAQRPNKSALKEIVKVVGGGVIGLTIGQLILWWLPGNLKRDPLRLGPKIPAFASFLVSPKFRAPAVAKQDGAATPQTELTGAAPTGMGTFGEGFDRPSNSFEGMGDINTNQDKNDSSPANQSSAADANKTADGAGQVTSQDGTASAPSSPPATETEEGDTGSQPDSTVPSIKPESFPTATGATPPPERAASDAPSITSPFAEPATQSLTPSTPIETTSDLPVATGDFEGVRNAPTISVDQLSARLAEAVSASIAMDTSATEPVPKQLTLAREFYTTLAGLGEAITFVDQASATDQVDEVGKFALEVGQHSAKLELIGKVAPSWMKNNRPHNGVVACGTVQSIDFAAPYYVTSLVTPSKSVLRVVSMINPSGDYQPQNKVLVLGSILDAPQQNLKNYLGDATTVVLDGLHATLPNAE